ncbi:MAG: hypothetical protein ACRBN8_36870 [Nannocystales bacterium]
MSAKHRGRIQVQGPDMGQPEPSRAWAQEDPPGNAAGLEWLEQLREGCTPRQRKRRREAFPRAERYIKRAAGTGLQYPVSKRFITDGEPLEYRVDLEVRKGEAFS